ncbi:MAG TPA: ABC transporter substrate-binding protein [Chloroflexota bacterium]|jgi:iron(III) transport system substrate-binding protein
MTSRRNALRLIGLGGVAALVAACSSPPPPAAPAPPTAPPAATTAPAAAPTTASAPPTAAQAAPASTAPAAASKTTSQAVSDADWQQVVDAAKKEGHLYVATYAGTGYRRVMDAFEAAYPGITVEQTPFQSSSRDFFPRYFQERQAGLYQWDVMLVPATEPLVQAVPQGAIDPIRPLIVRADVLDDKNWVDGFEGGWLDKGKVYSYPITRSRSQTLWIDTNQVKDGEIKSYKDLLDPKWNGKILAGDLRTKGSGFWPGTTLRLKTGSDDVIKQVWKDTNAVLSTDARQLTEQMVRGAYPIGLGAVSLPILLDFRAQGQGMNLKSIPTVELDYVNSGDHVLQYANKAPNPNAAKLFINWVLGKEGSTIYATQAQDNSRRADVPVQDATLVPEKGVDYITIDSEPLVEEILKTQKIATQVIG